MSLAVNLIGQRSRDVIDRLSVSRDVVGCAFFLLLVKKSVGQLLVKCLLFVCFVVVVNKLFVWCR